MTTRKSALLLLFGSIALAGLSGCEQLEQTANDAVEKATQSAVQALDEAVQTGSIDSTRQSAEQAVQDVKQSADRLLLDARQTAAGLLGQASEYLSREQQGQDTGRRPEHDSTSDL